MTLRNGFAALALMVAAVGIVLDFWGMSGEMAVSPGHPVARSLGDMLVWFWTFLTHIVTLVAALIYLADLSGWRALAFVRHRWVEAATLSFLVLAGAYFHFILAPLYPSAGVALAANWCLHYAGPAMFLMWWIFAIPHGTLRYGDILKMLAPGAVYLLWVLIRGGSVHDYPYPMFDPATEGYLGVAKGAALITVALAVIDFALVLADHRLRAASNRGMFPKDA